MIPHDEVERILKSVNIVDIMQSYDDVSLVKKGNEYVGKCPFHNDSNPSFHVSIDKQIYNCWSCPAQGNVVTFVKEKENVGFVDAIKIIAEKAGLALRGNYKEIKSKKTKYEKEYEIMKLALSFYQNNLNTEYGLKAKEYLSSRNLGGDVIKDFNLGLALDQTHSLNQFLLNKKYDIEQLVKLGLVNRSGDKLYDFFLNRVIFPIHDLEGNPIGFTGRIYEKSDLPKYLNTKETPIFMKGEILFNYHRALPEIKVKKEVVIVEGNMDAIRMYASGIKNVIALMGTSLTKFQVDIIKKLHAKIILMLDNDRAGEDATFTNGKLFEAAGLTPYIVRLSGEKDPDEYIVKNGVEALIHNIEEATDFWNFKIQYLKKEKDLTRLTDQREFIKEMVQELKVIPDEVMRKLVLANIEEQTKLSKDYFTSELDFALNSEKKIKEQPKILAKKELSKYDRLSETILYFMMNDGIYVEQFMRELGYFENKKYRTIANEIMYYYETYGNIDLSSFITFMETKEDIQDDVAAILKHHSMDSILMDTFKELIHTINQVSVKEKIKLLKVQIREELDADKKIKLAEELIKLKKGCVENE